MEADAKELREIISIKTGIDPEVVKQVLDELPHSVAGWLLGYGSEGNGEYRGEMHGGFIFTLKERGETEGHGVAEGVTIPPHFELNIKAHKVFLDKMGQHFHLPIKN
jgi:hypothetical protein